MHPRTKGAEFIWNHFLRDFLKENEEKIDATLHTVSKSSGKVMEEVSSLGSELGSKTVKVATEAYIEHKLNEGGDKKD